MKNLLPGIFILFTASCGQKQASDTQAASAPFAGEEKPKCEVEEKGQTLINKLMVYVENMTSASEKLHEVLEKHNHKDISEHSKQIESAILDLMGQSKILPLKSYNELIGKAKIILQVATEFTWHNNFHGKDKNTEAFSTLTSSIYQLKTSIKGMSDVPENICMTKREASMNEMRTQLAVMLIYSEQIDRAHDNNLLTCISGYCGRLEELVKSFRENIANLDSKDFTTLNRTLSDVEHESHEMSKQAEQAQYGELHHSLETINKAINRLIEEAGELS
jgi:hypothetical protein